MNDFETANPVVRTGQVVEIHRETVDNYSKVLKIKKALTTAFLSLSRCNNGVHDTKLSAWATDFSSLASLLSKSTIGPKDGSYFLRCSGTQRNNQDTCDTANILILDGDSTLNPETGEVTSGAPPPEHVHEVLVSLGVQHLIYTSHSNDVGYHKYRVILPCQYTPEQLPVLLDYCFNLLHKNDVWLAPASENKTWCQAWYFPRVPNEERLKLFLFFQHDGDKLDTSSIYEAWQRKQPIKEEPQPLMPKKKFNTQGGQRSPIAEFNQQFSCTGILLRNGYTQKGNRFLRPESESKIPGVQFCRNCSDGVERIYSHGGDDLNNGFAHDAFDCYQILECAGDSKKALNWNPEITKHNQRVYMKNNTDSAKNPSEKKHESLQWEKPRFKLTRITDITGEPKVNNWQIKNLLEHNNLALFFGEPESGKSLIAMDIAFCVAAGIDWNENKTTQGDVIYLAGEGYTGLARRFKALELRYGCKAERLFVSEQPAQLIDPKNTGLVKDAINTITLNPALIVIDTLHRNLGCADENSAKDLGAFISNIDNQLRATGTTVLIIHHSGHGTSNRSRGSSSIKAALDIEFKVSKSGKLVTMTCTKAKDFEKPKPCNFEIAIQELGWTSEDGEPVCSVWLSSTEKKEKPKGKRLSVRDGAILTSLDRAISKHGIPPTPEIRERFGGFDGFKNQNWKIVQVNHWRDEAYPVIDVDGDNSAKRKAFQRARNKLRETHVQTMDDYWWRVYDDGTPGQDGTNGDKCPASSS